MKTNQVRIIGGKWRSRKISFPDHEGLRPSSDRLRETLFNWLQPQTHGSVCLDAFAGSGALGFEALSRGAASVVMLEKSPAVVTSLQKNAELLKADNLSILNVDAIHYLNNTDQQFDLIFLDPPFKENLLDTCLTLIVEKNILKTNGRIYLEQEKNRPINILNNWHVLKKIDAGNVSIYLITHPRGATSLE